MTSRGKRTRNAMSAALCALCCVATFSAHTSVAARVVGPRGEVRKFRAERHKEFRDPKESPLEPSEVARFRGLAYYKIDRAYRVRARFARTPGEKKFGMPTSSGAVKVYVKYGELSFTLAGRRHTLSLYQSEALSRDEKYRDYLLLPFRDLTSGRETYGGGRYIDFKIPASEQVTVDFNLAYNPSCAYSHRFSCPVPPRENHLAVEIKAGEKAYRKPSADQGAADR